MARTKFSTTIAIEPSAKRDLQMFKTHPRQPDGEIIEMLIKSKIASERMQMKKELNVVWASSTPDHLSFTDNSQVFSVFS